MRTLPELNLSALAIFRQVAAAGSVQRAADQLHRVPSNVSTRIRQMEEQLGTTLLVRGARGVSLTDDGVTLLRYADRMLALSQEAVDALQTAELSGTFRVGTMESTAASRLPPVLSRFHTEHPAVQIHLQVDTAGGLTGRLLTHELDAIFLAEPLRADGLANQPVFAEQLMLVTPPEFNLAEGMAGLNGKTVVAFEEGCAYRRYLQDWLRETGVDPGTTLSVGSYLAIMACVAAGTGYAVIPKSVLETIETTGDLRVHPLPGRFQCIKTLLAWRDGFQSPKLDALRRLVSPEPVSSARAPSAA